jgi:hypothetical protein
MKVKKINALILLSFTLISIGGIIEVTATSSSLSQTNQLAAEINKNLLDNFLQNKIKSEAGSLLGHGWAVTDKFVFPCSSSKIRRLATFSARKFACSSPSP